VKIGAHIIIDSEQELTLGYNRQLLATRQHIEVVLEILATLSYNGQLLATQRLL
jgi:hypothetical protein